MKDNIYLDIHAIQTVPPANINRDDTGSPKTAEYGGITRARVSSQSWKKAIRDYFNEFGDINNVGIRSLRIPNYIADYIVELDESKKYDEALKMANDILNAAKVSTKDNKTKALLFIGAEQAKGLAKAAINEVKDKKELQKILNDNPPIDLALFGRMVADDPSLNEDASCQVAHAISTHGVQTEFDFFTATDDLSEEDNAGAGMLGTVEFNSSTLYRYANISVHELNEQLEDREKTVNAVKLFIEAFVKSMPTGKINTFANQSLPQEVIVTIRNDRPVNLVSAFENPIKSNNGYVNESIKNLKDEFKNIEKFVNSPLNTFTLGYKKIEKNGEEIGEEVQNLQELINKVGEIVSATLK